MKHRKLATLLSLGAIAMFAIGADDDCSVEDDPKPAKQANGGNNSNAKPASNEPSMSPGQENALQSAENYLSFSSFSKTGLINQLSSSAGDGFPKADAKFAVNHLDVNWKEQAYESAKNYLDISSFSLDGLIEQLASSAGDQFTQAQAEYGANKAYNE